MNKRYTLLLLMAALTIFCVVGYVVIQIDVKQKTKRELLQVAKGERTELSPELRSVKLDYLFNRSISGWVESDTAEVIASRLINARTFLSTLKAPETKDYMAAVWMPLPNAEISLMGESFLLMREDALKKAERELALLMLALKAKANIAITPARDQSEPTVDIALTETKVILGQQVELPLGVITVSVNALQKLDGHQALLKATPYDVALAGK